MLLGELSIYVVLSYVILTLNQCSKNYFGINIMLHMRIKLLYDISFNYNYGSDI